MSGAVDVGVGGKVCCFVLYMLESGLLVEGLIKCVGYDGLIPWRQPALASYSQGRLR